MGGEDTYPHVACGNEDGELGVHAYVTGVGGVSVPG